MSELLNQHATAKGSGSTSSLAGMNKVCVCPRTGVFFALLCDSPRNLASDLEMGSHVCVASKITNVGNVDNNRAMSPR